MAKPEHLFISDSDGALYDTRVSDWSVKRPLRRNFCRSHQELETLADLKATLRAGAYAWPGGYPFYLIMADCEPASFDGVRSNWREIVGAYMPNGDSQWRVVGREIHYEGAPLICCISNAEIESAYGDPEAGEESEVTK